MYFVKRKGESFTSFFEDKIRHFTKASGYCEGTTTKREGTDDKAPYNAEHCTVLSIYAQFGEPKIVSGWFYVKIFI